MINQFDPQKAVELFGNYGRKFKEFLGKKPNELGGSLEYKKFLRMQKYLMDLTGEQVIQMAEHYRGILNEEDIKNSSIYQDMEDELKNELNKTKRVINRVIKDYKKLNRRLEEMNEGFGSDLEEIVSFLMR